MLENYRLKSVEQLSAISKPVRWRMLVLLIENPMTGSQLARSLKIPRNTAHYHLHILEKAGLVTFQEERLNSSGIIEHYYRAIAKIFLSEHFFDLKNPAWEDGNVYNQKGMLQSLLLAIADQVKTELLQASDADMVKRGNFYFSYAVDLTLEQSQIIETDLRAVGDRILEFRNQNQSIDRDRLQQLHYTVLKTPPSPTDIKDLD
jgi:DNA-binding transcriptional ArsR family regulator